MLLLKVYHDVRSRFEVPGHDHFRGVVGLAEQLAPLLVMLVVVELQLLGGVVNARVLNLHVDDLELVCAHALAQVLLDALRVLQPEVECTQPLVQLLLEVVVLVAPAQALLELQLLLLVVAGDELLGGLLALLQLLLVRVLQVLPEVPGSS